MNQITVATFLFVLVGLTFSIIPPICGPNEHYTDCYNRCSEQTCKDRPPIACPMVCTMERRCVCDAGYVRGPRGNCIPKKLCPTDPCDGVYCLIGPCTVNQWGQPVCAGTLPPRNNPNSTDETPSDSDSSTVNPCANVFCLIGPCTVNDEGEPVCEGTLPPRNVSDEATPASAN